MSAVATETPAPTTGVLGAAHRVREVRAARVESTETDE